MASAEVKQRLATRDSLRKRKKKRKSHKSKHANLKCSSCGLIQKVSKNDIYHAARIRCSKCGGPLNRIHLA